MNQYTPAATENQEMADGSGEVIAGSGSQWFGGGVQTIMVGDTIVVPLDAEHMRPLTLWISVTQIICQLALPAAAFNAAGVFWKLGA